MRRSRLASPHLFFLFLFAFVLRFSYVCIHEHRVSERLLAQNAAYSYEQGWIARSILLGKGFSSPKGGDTGPTAMYTPIYPYILVPIYRAFGLFTRKSFIVALTLNCFWSALAIVPIFWVSRRLKPGTEGIAVWLWAIYPSVIVVSDLNWTQALSALLVALILWAASGFRTPRGQ